MPQPTSPLTVVLVHGAWADASSWSRVIPLLQAKGLRLVTAALPLTSLADDVAATKRALAGVDGPILLVAHSWGGAVITEAGMNPKVEGLVYVAGFANKEGQSCGELVNAYPTTPALGSFVDDGHGFLRQTEAGWIENVAPDLPAAEAKILAVIQTPFAASAFNDKVGAAAWRTKPTWFAVSANDRVVNVQMQHDFAAQMSAKTTILPSSHVSLLSHPAEVADLIGEAADAVMAKAA